MADAGATGYLRKTGWLKIYRGEKSFAALAAEFDVAAKFGLPLQRLEMAGAQALEPALQPVFAHAVFWPQAASVSNPLGVTRAYVARFAALGGVTLVGDARSLHRAGNRWRVETNEGSIDAPECVIALGPWAPDLLATLGLRLPLAIKRGYHRHFHAQGNAGLSRPVLDAEVGYLITPMEQGIRMTTGVEFAARDAPPTPVQFDRVLPAARELFPLGDRADDMTWLGSRPRFAGLAAGNRSRAGTSWALADNRARTLGSHARAGDRAHDCRNVGGRAAVLRSDAVSCRKVRLARQREFPKVVAIANKAVEERSFRKR